MGQLWEYVKMALANIRMNRGRSFLTMLGIIIGVSSVILIMSVGNGARMEMEQELTAVAGGQIYIYANSNLEEVPVITEAGSGGDPYAGWSERLYFYGRKYAE